MNSLMSNDFKWFDRKIKTWVNMFLKIRIKVFVSIRLKANKIVGF